MIPLTHQKWRTQPLSAIPIDQSNPLCRGMRQAMNGAVPGYNAAGAPIGVPTSGATPSVRSFREVTFAAAGDQIAYTGLTSGGGNVSVLWQGRLSSIVANRLAGTLGGGSDHYGWGFLVGFSRWTWSLRGLVDIDSGISTPTSGNDYMVGISYIRGVSATFYQKDLSSGGISVNTVSNATSPTTNAATSVVGALSGGNGWQAQMAFHYMWGRALSDWEMRALLENPWQVYQPISNAIYFPAPAAPAGGFFARYYYDQIAA